MFRRSAAASIIGHNTALPVSIAGRNLSLPSRLGRPRRQAQGLLVAVTLSGVDLSRVKHAILILNMILDITPYSTDKNLGKAYNDAISLLPEDSHACLRDGDTCWLTPDYGVHLAEYVRLFPNAILTCWTNRINEKAEQQAPLDRGDSDMANHITRAENYKPMLYKVTPLHGFVSGFVMVVPKSVWNQHKFAEKQVYEDRGPHNLLGVDNDFTNRVRAAGVQVLRMDGLYIWHTYRLLTGDQDKKHLL